TVAVAPTDFCLAATETPTAIMAVVPLREGRCAHAGQDGRGPRDGRTCPDPLQHLPPGDRAATLFRRRKTLVDWSRSHKVTSFRALATVENDRAATAGVAHAPSPVSFPRSGPVGNLRLTPSSRPASNALSVR